MFTAPALTAAARGPLMDTLQLQAEEGVKNFAAPL